MHEHVENRPKKFKPTDEDEMPTLTQKYWDDPNAQNGIIVTCLEKSRGYDGYATRERGYLMDRQIRKIEKETAKTGKDLKKLEKMDKKRDKVCDYGAKMMKMKK